MEEEQEVESLVKLEPLKKEKIWIYIMTLMLIVSLVLSMTALYKRGRINGAMEVCNKQDAFLNQEFECEKITSIDTEASSLGIIPTIN